MAPEANNPIDQRRAIPQDSRCRAVFSLEGMTCASCAMRIEKGLKKLPGVADAQVNLATERATVTYDPEQTGVEQMVQKVEAVGYQAMPLDQPAPRPVVASSTVGSAAPLPSVTAQQEDERSTRKQAEILHKRNILILGIILSLPIIVLTMFLMNRFPGEDYLLFALTTPSGPSWAGISTGERSRRCVMVARIWIP